LTQHINLNIKTFMGTSVNAPKSQDLDGLNCHAGAALPSTGVHVWLDSFKPGGIAYDCKSFRISVGICLSQLFWTVVTADNALELVGFVKELKNDVESWLKQEHPELISSQ
jgi:hypothetical protein